MKGFFTRLVLFILGLSRVGGAAPADERFYLPPGISDRVVFYHSFEKGLTTPDLNLIGAKLTLAGNQTEPGFVGAGYRIGSGNAAKNKGPLVLRSSAFSVHKPITVMFWWQLDEPMHEETGFNLLALRGKGWISTFVAGKGPWCALKEPTYVFQCYNFPGMDNCNDIWGGRAWFEPNVWHHVAISVGAAAEIKVIWDGKLRTQYAPKKRIFKEGEIDSAELGTSGNGPMMTLDEIIVLDRSLNEDEVGSYLTAVTALAGIQFPSCPSPKANDSHRVN